MCHLITAVAATRVEAEIRRVAKEHGLGFARLADSPVVDQLETGEGYYGTTVGHCDCGTPLGAANGARGAKRRVDRKVQGLRSKGWSEAKIARWLDQAEVNRERKAAERSASTKTCEAWCEFIAAALDAGAGSLGLMLHWYRGGAGTEEVEILRRVRVRRAELSPELLGEIDEDVLYEFVP